MELTNDQQKAYDYIADAYKKKTNVVLSGRAGVGKTFLTQKINKEIFQGNTAGITVSHKAKNILKKSVGSNEVDIMTYAKAMGKMPDIDPETGLTVFKSIGECNINHSNYFIDECSMFSPNMIKEFEEEVEMNQFLGDSFILYVGDYHQLPAIDNENIDFSPLFKRESVVTMNQIIRQEEDNPIRTLTNATADCIEGDRNVLALLKTFKSDFNKERQQGVVITRNRFDIVKTYVNAFNDNVEFGESNKMAIIAYRKDTVYSLNRQIRLKLGLTKEYQKGDIIMTTSNYKINKENFIQNGEEFWVEGVEYDIIEKIPCWKLFCFRMEEGKKISVELPVVMREHYKDYKKRKNELVTGMQNANYKKKGFHKNLIKKFTEKFCMVQHAHALTAYKAQGSTIDTVFFDCTDVLDVKPLNDLKKLQSIYVGLTRAANRLVIY